MKKAYTVNYIIPIIILIALIVVPILIFILGKHIYFNYQNHEEAKTKAKVHRVFKKKGWEDKIKTEEAVFTLNTGDNYLEVTFKDEPYNTYQYDIDDNGKITGDAFLKEKYAKYSNDKKHFEEKYDLK